MRWILIEAPKLGAISVGTNIAVETDDRGLTKVHIENGGYLRAVPGPEHGDYKDTYARDGEKGKITEVHDRGDAPLYLGDDTLRGLQLRFA